MKKHNYNTTQLDVFNVLERGIAQRDYYAHLFRWSHILKITKINDKVLDWGCGTGNLLELLYRNRHKCKKYLGLEYKQSTVNLNKEKFKNIDWADFIQQDLTLDDFNYGDDWDYIVSFEVAEHIGKQNANKFLLNVLKHMNSNTTFLISTPVYDPRIGAAKNHTYDSNDGRGIAPQEFTFEEMRDLLEKYFIIEKVNATFCSQFDYKHTLNDWQKQMFNALHEYYDSTILSIIMGPIINPRFGRNCIWKCKMKSKEIQTELIENDKNKISE